MSVRNLDALFRPSSVALIGASRRPESVGTVVMANLLAGGFEGPVLPVNPKYGAVQGVVAYPDLQALPLVPELAVICTPPHAVPGLVAELGSLGTRAAVVMTAGLDAAQRDAMTAAARQANLRVLGPNSIGLIAPHAGLNASFAQTGAAPGDLAFVSQSGALCTAALGWAGARGIGFSAFASLGDATDVDFGDVIDYLGSDPRTRAILLYIEAIHDAREFLSATRAASRNKPVVAIKAGRVAEGERAAASHTGALAGSDDVYDYALRRAGVLRVDRIDELFDAVETLQRVGRAAGDSLVVLTNGGGPGVMATDALVRGGGTLATLSAETVRRLDEVLPATWSRANPVDIIGDARPARFAAAARVLIEAPECEALLVLHAPTATAPSEDAARALIEVTRGRRVPMLTSWLGGAPRERAQELFSAAGVATYDTPEGAVGAFLHLSRYGKSRELLMQTPPSAPALSVGLDEVRGDAARARARFADVLAAGGGWLTEVAAKEVLRAYGVPVVETRLVPDAASAGAMAEELGFPVALKVQSPDALHKSDVGGVVLDLESRAAVKEAAAAIARRLEEYQPGARLDGFAVQAMARRPGAHEVFVGASVDPIFGPFLVFGQGGTAVEVLDDTAVALPPLNVLLADELVSRTRIARLLAGFRDRPAIDQDALRAALLGVSRLLAELPEVVELDVNPLLVDDRGAVALDARMRVAPAAADGPARFAIRPYPSELEETVTLRSGRRVLLRPIRPEDEPSHRRFFEELSPEDVRFRFFHLIRRLAHSELARYTQIDYEREMAFLAVDPDRGEEVDELGVVRAMADPDNDEAEFAIVVAPRAKGEGLGRALLEKMLRYLAARGTRVVVGRVLADNRAMRELARGLGFTSAPRDGGREVEVRLVLRDEP